MSIVKILFIMLRYYSQYSSPTRNTHFAIRSTRLPTCISCLFTVVLVCQIVCPLVVLVCPLVVVLCPIVVYVCLLLVLVVLSISLFITDQLQLSKELWTLSDLSVSNYQYKPSWNHQKILQPIMNKHYSNGKILTLKNSKKSFSQQFEHNGQIRV